MIHDNWVSSCLWSRGVRSERRGRLIPPQSPDAGSGWWLCWGRWGGWNNEAGVSAKVEGARRTADDNRLQHWQMEWVTGWYEEVNDQACRRTRFLTVLFYESFITEVFSDVSVNLTSEKVPNKVSKSRTRTRVEAQIDIKTVSVITFFGKDPKKKWQIHLVFCFFCNDSFILLISQEITHVSVWCLWENTLIPIQRRLWGHTHAVVKKGKCSSPSTETILRSHMRQKKLMAQFTLSANFKWIYPPHCESASKSNLDRGVMWFYIKSNLPKTTAVKDSRSRNLSGCV